MKKSRSDRSIRVPVRWVDGIWECGYGGVVPVKPGADGELLLRRSDIDDQEFLSSLERRDRFLVLRQGSKLLVSLAVKETAQLSRDQLALLIPYDRLSGNIATEFFEHEWTPGTLHLVEVIIDQPSERQKRLLETEKGGLWLLTEGAKAIGLASTTIRLPKAISDKPVASLNHAFTILSEVFEYWRISHTGNIYSRVLYEGANKRWYPLNLLRDAALDKKDEQIASDLWKSFMAKMSRRNPPQGTL
jgi:hypothetical protein